MIPAYFETHFRTDSPIDSWPDQFAIITGFATTGESWPDDRFLRLHVMPTDGPWPPSFP